MKKAPLFATLSAAVLSLISAGSAVGRNESQRILAPDAAGGDEFGSAVAVDGNTAVFGAPMERPNGTDVGGSAYVFTWNGTAWVFQQKLSSTDPQNFDNFGASVAISGDTIVVGSPEDDDAGPDSGSAFVYTRTGSTWTLQQKLVSQDASATDEFGTSVAVDGNTAIIGSPGDDTATTSAGSAYIFTRAGGVWTQRVELVATDAANDDKFGIAVDLDTGTAIIGASGDADAGDDTGSAYVFTGAGAAWTQQQKLVASNAGAVYQFGRAVAIDGNSIIVGAPREVLGSFAVGSAYIFVGSGANWTEQDKLLASDRSQGDLFGDSVDIEGDTALVGARLFDILSTGLIGSAYIFTRSGTAWTERDRLRASDPDNNDSLGDSVGLSGNHALAGIPGDDESGIQAGAVYYYPVQIGGGGGGTGGGGSTPGDYTPEAEYSASLASYFYFYYGFFGDYLTAAALSSYYSNESLYYTYLTSGDLAEANYSYYNGLALYFYYSSLAAGDPASANYLYYAYQALAYYYYYSSNGDVASADYYYNLFLGYALGG